MPFCPDCGAEVSEDPRFCPECGRRLVLRQGAKRTSKRKIAGIILACVITIIIVAVLARAFSTPSNYIYEDGRMLVGGDGEPIELVDNSSATNPTYAELVAFIGTNPVDTNTYFKEGPKAYVCADFAEDVHNDAEAAGIRAAWVSIDLQGEDEGHALNAFETSDRGLVYIDCTGERHGFVFFPQINKYVRLNPAILPESESESNDTIAYVEVGREYGRIDVAYAKSSSYGFYEEYEQKWQEYEELVSDYSDEVTLYNQAVTSYYEDASYGTPPPEAPDASEYGTSLEEQQRLFFDQLEWITEMLAWKEGAQDWVTEMEAQWVELEDWEARLQEKEQLIDELGEGLGDFRFEPLGIVEDINVYWGDN